MIESFLLEIIRFFIVFIVEIVLHYSPARLLRMALGGGTLQENERQGFMVLLWQYSLDIFSWGLVIGGIIFIFSMVQNDAILR